MPCFLFRRCTDLRSMVVWNVAFDFFGTKCGAHCHFAFGLGISNPDLTDASTYLFRNFLCSRGYRHTLAFTGFLLGLTSNDIGSTRAGSHFLSLILNILLCLLKVSRRRSAPFLDIPFFSAYRPLRSSSMFSSCGSSSPISSAISSLSNPSSSVAPKL